MNFNPTLSLSFVFYIAQMIPCQVTFGSVLPVPVAIYPLNAKFTVKDGSCYGNGAGQQVGVKLAIGPNNKPETAFEFMGTKQSYIEIPANQQLDTRYSMTVLAWVYYIGPSSGPVFSYVENQGLGVQLWVTHHGKLFSRLMARDGGLSDIITLESDGVNLTGRWYYVGVSFDHSSQRANLWIDGQIVHNTIILDKLELKTHGKLRIGSVSQKHTKHFRGKISCLQIYNKALSFTDIQAVKDRCLQDDEAVVNCRTVSFKGTCREHFTMKSGTFHSPGYPKGYPANINCIWTIQTKTDEPVKLKFEMFDLEDNLSECGDYVEIKDGLGSWDLPLKKYCGGARAGQDWIQATSDSMRVEFVTNGFVGGVGFMAQYNSSGIGNEKPDVGYHYTATVIGVAFAALFLVVTMFLLSRTRRLWRMHHRHSREQDLPSESDQNNPDAVQLGAPPSYAAVMRAPELYPPSPRVTPVHSRYGTPALTPKLGYLHGTPGASRMSISTTISSTRHSQVDITANETYDDEEEPPPYPGIVVASSLYARQSSVPISNCCSSRASSSLLFNGSRRKSQGDLDRPLDRYSRNLQRPVSSLGNGRDPLRRTSSFSRRPSPLIGICHQHSNMSLPGCTGGLRQTNSACSRQEQLSERRFNRLFRNEQCHAGCHLRKSGESWPSEQQLKQIHVYNGEEQSELSRSSLCLTLNYVNDPPPYPQTEERACCDSVARDESASASCSSGSTTKNDAITPTEHSTDRIVASETSRLSETTFDNNDCFASHNDFSTSNCETMLEHEYGLPDEFRSATCLQEHQENCSRSSSTVIKDGHENYDPDSLTNSESRFIKQNTNETEGNSVLPGQALVS